MSTSTAAVSTKGPGRGMGLRLLGAGVTLSLGLGVVVAGGASALAGPGGTRIAGSSHNGVKKVATVHLGPAVSYTRTAGGAVRVHH